MGGGNNHMLRVLENRLLRKILDLGGRGNTRKEKIAEKISFMM
jgi:hypothetical protein